MTARLSKERPLELGLNQPALSRAGSTGSAPSSATPGRITTCTIPASPSSSSPPTP